MALLVVAGLTSCSPDDMPQLKRLVAPVLNDLPGAIDGNSTVYTFTWDAARFYMDDDTHATGIGSYEYQGIQYVLQGDLQGNEFANPVAFGTSISKNYFSIDYENMAQIMIKNFGMVRKPDETSTANMEFRLVATYGSNESTSVLSNVIQVPFTLTVTPPVTGPKGKIYICDLAGWGAMALYAYPEGGSIPSWPGLQPTGTVTKGRKTYYEFTPSDDYYGTPLNYIANNNNNGKQVDIMQSFTLGEEDVYLTVFINEAGGFAYEIDEDPAPKMYVKSDLGWSDYSMYVWAGGDPVEAGWPGVHYASIVNINGEDWMVFEMSRAYSKAAATNWIINNNNNGLQFDLMQGFTFDHDVFVRVAADGSFTASNGPVLNGEDQFTVYACIDDCDWTSISFYVWGELGPICGDWPGQPANGSFTIGGANYYYHTFTANVPINVIVNNSGAGDQCPDIVGNTDIIIKVGPDNKSFEVVKTF